MGNRNSHNVALTAEEIEVVRQLVSDHGEREVCERILSMPRHALARLLGRLPVRAGTVALARVGLARCQDHRSTPPSAA